MYHKTPWPQVLLFKLALFCGVVENNNSWVLTCIHYCFSGCSVFPKRGSRWNSPPLFFCLSATVHSKLLLKTTASRHQFIHSCKSEFTAKSELYDEMIKPKYYSLVYDTKISLLGFCILLTYWMGYVYHIFDKIYPLCLRNTLIIWAPVGIFRKSEFGEMPRQLQSIRAKHIRLARSFKRDPYLHKDINRKSMKKWFFILNWRHWKSPIPNLKKILVI